jgi:hypothetical protein
LQNGNRDEVLPRKGLFDRLDRPPDTTQAEMLARGRSMKSIAYLSCLALVVLVAVILGQSGCASLTQTSAEHMHTYDVIVKHDMLTLPDDWDLLWEMDRPTRLSRWIVEY